MSSQTIRSVLCKEVFSERGYPAVEALVTTENGCQGRAMCTAGVSVGTHEVQFSYDGGSRFGGRGVSLAVKAGNEVIAPGIIGMDVTDQQGIDSTMLELQRNNPGKNIGGNTLAAISAAVLKAGAEATGVPLYRYIGKEDATLLPNASYGGYFGSTRYGSVLKAGVKPTCAFIAYDFSSFSEAADALIEITYAWTELARRKYGLRPCSGKGDVICAGFLLVPPGYVKDDRALWDDATEVLCRLGYENRAGLQIDVAADSFYNKETGIYKGIFSTQDKDREKMIEYIIQMTQDYPFVIIEDPLHEDDYEGHAIITEKTGIQIVGDDLFTTDSARVRQGAALHSCNTVLMKVNQIGTISQALDMVKTAYELGYGVMPCNSRGEGIDIADYCVGIRAANIRECSLGNFGNRFLQIERELGPKAQYSGKAGLKGSRFREDGAE